MKLFKTYYSELTNMHKFLGSVLCILSIGMTLMTLSACGMFKNYPQDNIIEEAVEEAIKIHLGLDLDLSPESSEDKREN